jgi:DNA-binding LytR/AlgR family response regulator
MTKNLTSIITYLEASNNYTYIYYLSGNQYLSSYTLLLYENSLPDFIRINRKYLVNPEYISCFELNSPKPHIVLKCGKVIKVPRRKVRAIERHTI